LPVIAGGATFVVRQGIATFGAVPCRQIAIYKFKIRDVAKAAGHAITRKAEGIPPTLF